MITSMLHAVVRVADARTPDTDLLERFIHTKDEAAFEELVRRHGPLVWSVCRQLLPHHADAEDAFQAVFLSLVRGAGGIRTGQALPGWLHGVALRVAVRVKRAAVRRRQREQRAAVREADRPVPDAAWATLMTAVHEEVRQLPAPERTAFILCDLEGVRQPDAAARLGWPLGTLSGRLCKARQKLLEQLTRRGIAPVVLAVGGLAGSAGSVPAALVAQVNSFPTAVAGGISSTVAGLASGLVEGVTMRMKIAAATLLVVGALGFSGGAMVLSKADAQGRGSASSPPPATATEERLLQPGSGGAAVVPRGQGGVTASGGTIQLHGGHGELVISDIESELLGVQGQPLVAVGPQGPGFGGVMIAGASRWEYKFVELRSDDRGPFEKEITSAGNDGWEYAGSERLRKGNDAAQLVLVFKRPKGGAVSGKLGGEGGGGLGGRLIVPGVPTVPGVLGVPGRGKGAIENDTRVINIESRVIKLKHAIATDVARTVEMAFPKNQLLKVIAEPTTNSVVVVAEAATMKDITKMIDNLDGKPGEGSKTPGLNVGGSGAGYRAGLGGGGGSQGQGLGGNQQGGGPRQIQVIVLKHAIADELAPVLKRVFNNAEITPDSRTNQLIIRADEKTASDVSALIQRLDVQIKK